MAESEIRESDLNGGERDKRVGTEWQSWRWESRKWNDGERGSE